MSVGRRVGVVLLAALATACGDGGAPAPDRPSADLSLVATLGGADTAGYRRASEVRDFVFPDDHGPHPTFRTEWWYVTGNLSSESGEDFGFQLTIFRSALAPTPPDGPSAWATNQAYMGHFALTDVSGGEHRAAERFARGAGGLAGARVAPFRVWIEDWVIESENDDARSADSEIADRGAAEPGMAGDPARGGSIFPLRLSADAGGVRLDLRLEAGKPLVLQGERGLSRKGPEPGNASYYYAHTRMPAAGTVEVDGRSEDVSGLAWLDREWSTSALSAGLVGWDWFALQLDDGWELMVYRLRREDGSAAPESDGALIAPDGRRVGLDWGSEVVATPTGTWRSPLDGAAYPSGWRIVVPDRGWDLAVEPAVADQELRLAFRYWEGAVRVRGSGEAGAPVTGRGYVELTGYAEDGPR